MKGTVVYQVVREFDLLSSAEIIEHAKEAAAAKAKELAAWDKLAACEFELLSKTQDVIIPRWAWPWKTDAEGSKIVKARLVVKGF